MPPEDVLIIILHFIAMYTKYVTGVYINPRNICLHV